MIWSKSDSPFSAFMAWAGWVYERMGRNHGIALGTLAELLFLYLTGELGLDPPAVAKAVYADYQRGGRSDKPAALRPYLAEAEEKSAGARPSMDLPKRQARHLIPRLERKPITS
jgi:hypothetical protein